MVSGVCSIKLVLFKLVRRFAWLRGPRLEQKAHQKVGAGNRRVVPGQRRHSRTDEGNEHLAREQHKQQLGRSLDETCSRRNRPSSGAWCALCLSSYHVEATRGREALRFLPGKRGERQHPRGQGMISFPTMLLQLLYMQSCGLAYQTDLSSRACNVVKYSSSLLGVVERSSPEHVANAHSAVQVLDSTVLDSSSRTAVLACGIRCPSLYKSVRLECRARGRSIIVSCPHHLGREHYSKLVLYRSR